MRLLIAFLIGLLSTITAEASYLVLTPDATVNSLDSAKLSTQGAKGKRVHIVTTSRGSDLGASPMISAMAKALRLQKLFPNELVVVYAITTTWHHDDTGNDTPLYASDSNGHGFTPAQLVASFSFKQLVSSNAVLNVEQMVAEMLGFNNIASLDAFGHAGIRAGIFLDGVGDQDTVHAWQPFDAGTNNKNLTASIKSHFTDDAFAYIHGCNAGHLQAQWMAKIWGIPVAGNFTSAHFEVDYNSATANATPNYWWSNDFEPDLTYLTTMRMKSDDVNYTGSYGNYLQGLPIYKFFCVGIDPAKCQKGMAMSALSIVTTLHPKAGESAQDFYGDVLREYLCPSDIHGLTHDTQEPYTVSIQAQCISLLENVAKTLSTGKPVTDAQMSYMPYRGDKAMACKPDNSSCYADRCYAYQYVPDEKEDSPEVPIASTCAKNLPLPGADSFDPSQVPKKAVFSVLIGKDTIRQGSSTFMNEYLQLLNGFALIKQQLPSGFMM